MLRALSRGTGRRTSEVRSANLLALRNQYRQLTQAVRFGDLSEARVLFDQIRQTQMQCPPFSPDAEEAFDALGEAICSGSLADTADALRLFRMVLEGAREAHPTTPLRSGIAPAMGPALDDELPETATLQDFSIAD